ncbi:MAG: phosphoadenylyl-sulfate reductase [Acidobacteria bacterium]|nr:phosphoadenylyl-sulfate reductase [Acidobacteriota bacterium]|tara:strand:- start:341 stop:1087 length:747 start_codon:yes stop_codon:yes gene_type:complete
MTKTLSSSGPPAEITSWSEAFEEATPIEILAWASNEFKTKLTFATGFGAEGCVLIDLIGRYHLPVDIFTLDTGLLFPETYNLWRRLEDQYKIVIRGVSPALTVDKQTSRHGPELWSRKPDECCEIRKLSPLFLELSSFDAWVTAIRRDQTPDRADAPVVGWDKKFNLVKLNPLVRWSRKDVWAYLLRNKVPYNPLHDQGYPSIGCRPCTSSVSGSEEERAGRWRDLNKTECGLHTVQATSTTGSPERR